MQIMAVINRKGGVGKTTISTNLAAEIAISGKRVLYIDIDPQGNGTSVVSAGQSEFDVSIADLLDNPKTPIERAIKQSPYGFDYIPSVKTLSRVFESIVGRFGREMIIKKYLDKLNGYDYVVIDCPPDAGLGTLNAIVAAGAFIIPVDGGSFALNGLSDLLDLLAEVKDNLGKQYQYMILRNEYRPTTKIMNSFLDSQLASQGNHVLKTMIRHSAFIEQAVAMCMPVRSYKLGSVATQDMKDFTKEVIGRLN